MVPHNSNILHDYSTIMHPGMDIDTIHRESLSRAYVCVSITMVKAQNRSITKTLTSVAFRSLPHTCHLILSLFASPTAANSLKPCISHSGMFSCTFPSMKSNSKPTLGKDGGKKVVCHDRGFTPILCPYAGVFTAVINFLL